VTGKKSMSAANTHKHFEC